MFGGSLTGWYEEQHGKSKTDKDIKRWTKEQRELSKEFAGYLTPLIGKGATPYER